MGLFNLFRKKKKVETKAKSEKANHTMNRAEYEAWLNFVSNGGTDEQWENLVKANNWHFKDNDYEKYTKEVQYVSDKYFDLLPIIQREWSVLYNSKDYIGKQAEEFEQMCLSAIDYYIEMRKIDLKYNQKTPRNVPAFTRLAMLYEKQGKFEQAAFTCQKACLLDIDEISRLARMIKKAGRTPTAEEEIILSKERNNLYGKADYQ